jgi:RNA polymerase sigma factor (sigma-70 family)
LEFTTDSETATDPRGNGPYYISLGRSEAQAQKNRLTTRLASHQRKSPVAVSGFGIALPENLLPFPMAGCSIMNDCLDMDDRQLLTEYATRNSEDAFRTLVERHAGFVYHTALRQVGNHHQAEEITQAVFIALARKAGRINANTVLSGWLFRATRYAIANHLRSNARRQRYEQEAMLMQSFFQPGEAAAVSDQMTPHLNDALNKLSDKDREAVLIRFFQNKSHKEVAQMLGVSEDAAKVRISRAMEKLRLIFSRQGIVVPAAVFVAALGTCSVKAAPAGLTASVTAVALAKVATSSASTLTMAKCVSKLMTWAKAKMAIAIGAGLIFAAGGASIIVNSVEASKDNAISQLERETGKKIVWDKRLNLPLTFVAKNLSFEEALDRLSLDADAYWTADYAIYNSDRTLRQLLSALHEGVELQSAGWTNLSSGPHKPDMSVVQYRGGARIQLGTNTPGSVVTMLVMLGREASVQWAQRRSEWIAQHKQAVRNHESPALHVDSELRATVEQAMKDGISEGVLIPERMLAETALAAKLNTPLPASVTPETAAQIAKTVHASWTTIYTLRKSPIEGAGIKLIHNGRRSVSGGDMDTSALTRRTSLTSEERAAHERAVQALKQKPVSNANPISISQ